jgi:tetratricopeptide (TPR) repeat protein
MAQRSIFISFSHRDSTLVERLAAALRSAGAEVWYDEPSLMAGDAWVSVLQQAIERASIFVVVLTPSSVVSPWVQREIGLALTLQRREPDRIIVPIEVGEVEIPLLLESYLRIRYDPNKPFDNLVNPLIRALDLQALPASAIQAPVLNQGSPDIHDLEVSGLIAEGDELRDQGRFELALMQYEKAIEKDPASPRAWALKASVLAVLGRLEDSLQAFNEALQRNPMFVTAWRGKVEILRKLHEYGEVVDACDHVLALDSADGTTLVTRASALWMLKRYGDAASAYARIMEVDPTIMGDMVKSIRSIIRRMG